jgi:hypothetical protein
MGYDATRMLISAAWGEGGPLRGSALADRLRAAPAARGLGHRIHFDGGQVNTALFLMGFRGSEAVLLNE